MIVAVDTISPLHNREDTVNVTYIPLASRMIAIGSAVSTVYTIDQPRGYAGGSHGLRLPLEAASHDVDTLSQVNHTV